METLKMSSTISQAGYTSHNSIIPFAGMETISGCLR